MNVVYGILSMALFCGAAPLKKVPLVFSHGWCLLAGGGTTFSHVPNGFRVTRKLVLVGWFCGKMGLNCVSNLKKWFYIDTSQNRKFRVYFFRASRKQKGPFAPPPPHTYIYTHGWCLPAGGRGGGATMWRRCDGSV